MLGPRNDAFSAGGALGNEGALGAESIDVPPRLEVQRGHGGGAGALVKVRLSAIASDLCEGLLAVSYTHLTLPTNREV